MTQLLQTAIFCPAAACSSVSDITQDKAKEHRALWRQSPPWEWKCWAT